MKEISSVRGSGGGGKAKQPRQPVEAKNTLQSNAKGRILDLLAFGPIAGPVDGLKSVYLNGTPVMGPDGQLNFNGVYLQFRAGYPDQDIIEGFRAVENAVEVGTEVKYDQPVVRAILNSDADAAVVNITLQGLVKQDKSTGDINGHSVNIAIDWRPEGGTWRTMVSDNIRGKTTSPYQRSYRVSFHGAKGGELRVRRLSPDETESGTESATFWSSTTEVIDRRLSYPDMALMGIEVDAKEFGNQMPSREYDLYLSIIDVPSNYNPRTRTYTGIWDGTFKKSWTDNPAWVFYDLATHPIIGADIQYVDKWALYQIAQYCDGMVPNGRGGMEPRFTFNSMFSAQEDAISALTTLASAFRGMIYWGSNTAVAVADRPMDPVKLVTPANVVDGEFSYAGTSMKERHSVAVVTFNDPENNFESTPVLYEDPESVRLFGWREVRVTAVGCTSRGQAMRLAKWILYSERMETETVTYRASMDHADLRPGDIIQLVDPDRAGSRLGGRVLESISTTKLRIDKNPSELTGIRFLSVVMPNGVIERKEVLGVSDDVVTLKAPLFALPVKGAVWVMSSTGLKIPEYRVASVGEDGEVYRVTAAEWQRNKCSSVELGLDIPEPPTSLIPVGPLAPPKQINVRSATYLAGGNQHQKLSISWTPGNDPRVVEYQLQVQGPGEVEWRTAYSGPALSHEELDVAAGEWMFRVKSVNGLGVSSNWVALTTQIAGLLLPVKPDSVRVEVDTFTVALYPVSINSGALYEFWRSGEPLEAHLIEDNAVRITVSNNLTDVGLRPGTTYFYYIRGINAYGVSDWFPVQATTAANFDDILTALDEDIRKPGGLFDAMVESALGAVGEGVADEVAGIIGEDLQQARSEAREALDTASLLQGSMQMGEALERIRHRAALALTEGLSSRARVEEVVRSGEDYQLDQKIERVEAEFNDNKASVEHQMLALATADEALAANILDLQAQVNDDISASLLQESQARASADAALASQITALQAQVNDDISASLLQESQARATADEALALQITQLSAKTTDDIQAAVSAESLARTNADTALASQISSVSAVANARNRTFKQATAPTTGMVTGDLWFDNNNKAHRYSGSAWVATDDTRIAQNAAAITSESTARADADTALASQISSLSASVDGQFASLSTTYSTQAYTDGAVARAVTTATVNGKSAIFGISVNGTVAEIGAVADRFFIYNPNAGNYTLAFAVVNGQTVIQDALIRNASITTAKIADASITSAKISESIQSDDFVNNTTGWRLEKNGNFQINGSVAGQGRIQITNRAIKVFDGQNPPRLRVQLGDLTV